MSKEEEQLLITGRVIAATRTIESRLVECGATGTGLREKSESLGSKISPEVKKLLSFIGGIRNRFAHENAATLRPDELELFEEAIEAVLEELETLDAIPSAQETPPPAPEKKKAPSPPRRERPTPAFDAEPALPPADSGLWAALPGLHLIYAFLTGWSAFGAGQLYLLLILLELGSLAVLVFSAIYQSLLLCVIGAVLLLALYGCGVILGHRARQEYTSRLYLIPILNLIYFAARVIRAADCTRLFVSVTVFGVWAAAIQLAIYGEYLIAAGAALLSWGIAGVDALFRHRRTP